MAPAKEPSFPNRSQQWNIQRRSRPEWGRTGREPIAVLVDENPDPEGSIDKPGALVQIQYRPPFRTYLQPRFIGTGGAATLPVLPICSQSFELGHPTTVDAGG